MDAHTALHRAIDHTERIVATIGDDDLGRPTPCDEFDVRALLNHLVASTTGLADAAGGTTWDMSLYGRDLLGDDPGGAFRDAAARLRSATPPDPADVERTWAMPSGDAPGAMGAAVATLELTQHAWDLAKALGRADDDAAFDDELAEYALGLAHQNLPPDDQRTPASFGPTVAVPGDAPAHDRLAGFMGRRP
jgi:uncharacterized protein (TIGR03086 family)